MLAQAAGTGASAGAAAVSESDMSVVLGVLRASAVSCSRPPNAWIPGPPAETEKRERVVMRASREKGREHGTRWEGI